MDNFMDRLPIPRRLSARVWLLTLPSAVVSFERRQDLPKLPKGLRFLGLPFIAFGVALALWAWRSPDARIPYNGPGDQLTRKPATAGGLLALSGIAILMRSLALSAYTIALAFAATTERVTVDEPKPDWFLGRDGD
jgi:hypothetical protein